MCVCVYAKTLTREILRERERERERESMQRHQREDFSEFEHDKLEVYIQKSQCPGHLLYKVTNMHMNITHSQTHTHTHICIYMCVCVYIYITLICI
jgi:hypothetical protein